MAKNTKRKTASDLPQDFASVARRLGCDEDKERFDKRLADMVRTKARTEGKNKGKTMRKSMLLAAALATSLLLGTGSATAETFTIFDVSGASATYALAINSGGTVTGYYTDSGSSDHGFVRAADGTITTFDPKQSVRTRPVTINTKGEIAGYYYDGHSTHGFVRSPKWKIAKFDPQGSTYTEAFSINDGGSVTGTYSPGDSKWYGFERARDGTISIFAPPKHPHWFDMSGSSINKNGRIAGTFVHGPEGAFVKNGETYKQFHVQGSTYTGPVTINSAGIIAGSYQESPTFGSFLRDVDGTITTFMVSGSPETLASSMNATETITGYYLDSNETTWHGFLRTSDGTITEFDLSGSTDTYPESINDNGTIAGFYVDSSGFSHGFVRTP